MKNSKFQYFSQVNFLNDSLYKEVSDFYNENKIYNIRNLEPNNNYKHDIPLVILQIIESTEIILKEYGCKDPMVFSYETMPNPYPKSTSIAKNWHKDFNLVPYTNDPLKLWFTMLSVTNQECNSTLSVSPSAEGPSFWNIGCEVSMEGNTIIGHNMNLGHHYIPKDKNILSLIYIRWFDLG